MTDPFLPSAGALLAEAVTIALDPTSTELAIRRGELLLAIAHELNVDAQWRSMRGKVTSPKAPPAPEVDETRLLELARRFREGSVPAETGVVDAATWDRAVRTAKGLEGLAAAVLSDPGTTQRLPIVWSVGDKADCRHCHTPIELRELSGASSPAGPYQSWQHKYTGQTVCATPITAEQIADGERPMHTFAEPEVKG